MNHIHPNRKHILEQAKKRYSFRHSCLWQRTKERNPKNSPIIREKAKALFNVTNTAQINDAIWEVCLTEIILEEMLERVTGALATQAPEDWRFTQSPSARFFVVDLETQVKILGVSYRDWGRNMLKQIQEAIQKDEVADLSQDIGKFIDSYVEGLYKPDRKIGHELVTAYPQKGGEIGEEKRLFAGIKERLEHAVPLQEKKLAARPNAIVVSRDELWVRQHLNWVNLQDANKEFFLFERLTPRGINKCQRKIFSYTSNGIVKEEATITVTSCPQRASVCWLEVQKTDSWQNYRTDAYWTLPTYLDQRLIALDFRDRQPEKAEAGPLSRDEVVELHFLRRLVQAARSRFL